MSRNVFLPPSGPLLCISLLHLARQTPAACMSIFQGRYLSHSQKEGPPQEGLTGETLEAS
jgi:hypothetical protein